MYGTGMVGSPLARAQVQLGLVAAIQVFGLSVWFTITAVAPSFQEEMGLSTSEVGWMTVVVQGGFVVGAVLSALFRLADRVAPRYLIAISGLGAAACTLGTAVTDTYSAFLLLRFLTGVFLAGIYPVGMKVVAEWASPTTKARAFGVLIACLTIGSAMPLLIRATLPLPWRWVMVTAASFALVAALVAVLFVRDGPNAPASTGKLRLADAFTGFRLRRPRLINFGYIGHMWELYAFWAWLPLFLAAVPVVNAELTSFIAIGLFGALGAYLGGKAADRFGRERSAGIVLAVSCVLCAVSPAMFLMPGPLVVALCCLWGAVVIADSGMFSTALSDNVPASGVGTALTLQTAAGFLATVISIQAVSLLAEATSWQWAFLLLLPGPLIGMVAMLRAATPPVHPPRTGG